MNFEILNFLEANEFTVFISLFKNLNLDVLKGIQKKINEKDELLCFLNTELIISVDQLYEAIYRTVLNLKRKKMKTKCFSTELISNISPTNNLIKSIEFFGISKSSSNIIFIKLFDQKKKTICFQNFNYSLIEEFHMKNEDNVKLSKLGQKKIFNLEKFKDIFNVKTQTSHDQDEIKIYTSLAIGESILSNA